MVGLNTLATSTAAGYSMRLLNALPMLSYSGLHATQTRAW